MRVHVHTNHKLCAHSVTDLQPLLHSGVGGSQARAGTHYQLVESSNFKYVYVCVSSNYSLIRHLVFSLGVTDQKPPAFDSLSDWIFVSHELLICLKCSLQGVTICALPNPSSFVESDNIEWHYAVATVVSSCTCLLGWFVKVANSSNS